MNGLVCLCWRLNDQVLMMGEAVSWGLVLLILLMVFIGWTAVRISKLEEITRALYQEIQANRSQMQFMREELLFAGVLAPGDEEEQDDGA